MSIPTLDTIRLLASMCFRDAKRRRRVLPALLESARLGLEFSAASAAAWRADSFFGRTAAEASRDAERELAAVEEEFLAAGGRRGVLSAPPIGEVVSDMLGVSSVPGVAAGQVLINAVRIEEYQKGASSLNKAVVLAELEKKPGVEQGANQSTVNQRIKKLGEERTIKKHWSDYKEVAPLWAAALTLFLPAQLGSTHRPTPVFAECLMVYLTSRPLRLILLRRARWFADWGETFKAPRAKQSLLDHNPSAPWGGARPERPTLWPLSSVEMEVVDGYRSPPPKPRAPTASPGRRARR